MLNIKQLNIVQFKITDILSNLFARANDFLVILQTQDPRGVRDLVRDLNHHFLKPMSSIEKVLAAGIIFVVVIIALFLTYKAIRLIWAGDDGRKDKKLL